jgi:integrase
MDLEPLKVRDIEGSEALTEQEAEMLLDFAKKQDFKPMVQYMFFKIAILTALRKDSLLKLQWNNIRRRTDRETGKEFYCISVYDKTDRRIIPLRDDVYEELQILKDPAYMTGMKIEDNRVFKISEDKLVETLKKFCEEYGIQRKITLHSLRKTSADIAYSIVDGDIKRIQEQTGHKSVQVLVNRYQGTRSSLSNYPGLMMFDDSLDMGMLEQYSKEEIVKAIGKCGKGVLREILSKLGER